MRCSVLAAALALSAPLWAEEKAKSGLEKGSGVPAFEVTDITGPNSSKAHLCYR